MAVSTQTSLSWHVRRQIELKAAGKTVKVLTVGKKGRDAIKRDLGDDFVGHVDLTEVKRVGYDDAQGIARDILNTL